MAVVTFMALIVLSENQGFWLIAIFACCCFWYYFVGDSLWDANSLFSSIWFESSIQTAVSVCSGPKPCRLFGEKLEQNRILLLRTNMWNSLRSTGVITKLRSYACMPSMRSCWCSVYNIYYEEEEKMAITYWVTPAHNGWPDVWPPFFSLSACSTGTHWFL